MSKNQQAIVELQGAQHVLSSMHQIGGVPHVKELIAQQAGKVNAYISAAIEQLRGEAADEPADEPEHTHASHPSNKSHGHGKKS